MSNTQCHKYTIKLNGYVTTSQQGNFCCCCCCCYCKNIPSFRFFSVSHGYLLRSLDFNLRIIFGNVKKKPSMNEVVSYNKTQQASKPLLSLWLLKNSLAGNGSKENPVAPGIHDLLSSPSLLTVAFVPLISTFRLKHRSHSSDHWFVSKTQTVTRGGIRYQERTGDAQRNSEASSTPSAGAGSRHSPLVIPASH